MMSAQDKQGGNEEPGSNEIIATPGLPGAGDFRGSYGFGRPAHHPDPGAKYVFEPDQNRVLPPRGEIAVFEGPADLD